MSRVGSQLPLHVPVTLESQLHAYRRHVWLVKLFEATALALFGIALGYLVVFGLDRLGDTPHSLRAAVFAATTICCAALPLVAYRWIWRRRRFDQLASLLARKLPQLGDQLLGILELAERDSQSHGASSLGSRSLSHAAIMQVAEDARGRDLSVAAPPSRGRLWATLAGLAMLAGASLAVLFPQAAANAWSRFSSPWKQTPRFTFAAVEPLLESIVVPHGEPFEVVAEVREASLWRPAKASARLGGGQTLEAELEGGEYRFQAPPLIDVNSVQIRVGDWRQTVRIEPKLRPELTALELNATLPAYLGRPERMTLDARSGAASLVKGSQATLLATANRSLDSVAVDGSRREITGSQFTAGPIDVVDSAKVALQWKDRHGLECKHPLVVSLSAEEDQIPYVVCEDLPRRRVILDSEQLSFQVEARDDFGVRHVGMQWSGSTDYLVEEPASGERILAEGGHDRREMVVQGVFTAKSLGIEPQPIELRLFTNDYYPERERVYSAPYLLYVLSAEQHAIWVTEQLAKWQRQSLEVRDRELRLYETNKELRELSAEQLDQPQNRRRLETQALEERANGRRLARLTIAGEDLLRQASRNPEIGVGHLDSWAEMLQILKDIAGNRMPTVADMLKEAQQAPAASQTAASSAPAVGQVRGQGAASAAKQPPGAKPPPAAPQIVDMESTQQPTDPQELGEAKPKNPSSPGLRLPTTTLLGKGKPADDDASAKQRLEEAVVEQKDLLAEFEKVANELNALLANLEGSTLVKRLKAASRQQYRIAGRIADQIETAFGGDNSEGRAEFRQMLDDLSEMEEESSYQVSYIMDDMQAYFERRRLIQFKNILEEMRSEDVIGALRKLSDDIPQQQGVSMTQCEYWSDAMDRWAEDLVDPASSGACPGCRSKGSLPPSIILEVLQVLEGEINLREETRVAEQARPGVEPQAHRDETVRLSTTQDDLRQRVEKVVERIGELPDAEQEFAREIALLGRVGQVMQEATELLAAEETGPPALAAETEAIELLLQSKRINPGAGGGGGASPGGGGGGDTQDSALALLGAGINQQEVREERAPPQVVGDSGDELPEEFRGGLNRYFHALEEGAAYD